MDIECERTIDDLIEFNFFHVSQSKSIQRQLMISRILFSVLTLLLTYLLTYVLVRRLSLFGIFVGILAGLCIFFLYPAIYRRSSRRSLKKVYSEGDNRGLLGRSTISLRPEGIFSKFQAGESKYLWSSVDKVAQNEKYIFIYVSAVNAIVVPKNAFASENEIQEFVNFIQTHCAQNK